MLSCVIAAEDPWSDLGGFFDLTDPFDDTPVFHSQEEFVAFMTFAGVLLFIYTALRLCGMVPDNDDDHYD